MTDEMKPPKRVHWTQTAKGRKIMSERAKSKLKKVPKARRIEIARNAGLAQKKRNRKPKPFNLVDSHETREKDDTILACGRVQGWLELYAEIHGLPPKTLAYRVGEFLSRSARR